MSDNENNMTTPLQQSVGMEPASRVLKRPEIVDLKPRITVFGVGGGGGNAVNNMINSGLEGVEFIVANTDAQALKLSRAERKIQLGVTVTEGLGAGSDPEIGRAAAEECIHEILDHIGDSNMVFITCGMGGGTGTGAAPVIARAARERDLLTVGVVTKPFHYEGSRKMKRANAGIAELQKHVDTLIVIPNQNLFRIANENTPLVDALAMADQVLYAGVASITDLMVREGLINLDFADVRSIMLNMGYAMMGTGEASGEGRALAAAEAAVNNPLLDASSMHGARGLLISVTGGHDMTLTEVNDAVMRVSNEVDPDANVNHGVIIDEALEGLIRISVVATGIDLDGEGSPYMPFDSSDSISGSGATASKKAEISDQAPQAHSETGIGAQNSQANVEGFNLDVMEALEEEIVESLEDDFRPQSRIFMQEPRREVAATAPQHTDASAMPSMQTVTSSTPTSPLHVDDEAIANLQPRVPNLEDFPAAIQQTIGRKADPLDETGHGVRGLLKKITQGFGHRDDEEPLVRLEPAEIMQNVSEPTGIPPLQGPPVATGTRSDVTRPDLSQGLPRATPQPSRVIVQDRAPKREDMFEDELEIPSFLRRQVN